MIYVRKQIRWWRSVQSRFKWEDLNVSRSGGLNFFSLRNHNDKSYGKGRKIDNDDDVYDLNGFQIRFFGEQHSLTLNLQKYQKIWLGNNRHRRSTGS